VESPPYTILASLSALARERARAVVPDRHSHPRARRAERSSPRSSFPYSLAHFAFDRVPSTRACASTSFSSLASSYVSSSRASSRGVVDDARGCGRPRAPPPPPSVGRSVGRSGPRMAGHVLFANVTELLPNCYRTVTELLPNRYRTVTELLPNCYRTVTELLPNCYRTVTELLPNCYRTVTELFPNCYRTVTELFPNCDRTVPELLRNSNIGENAVTRHPRTEGVVDRPTPSTRSTDRIDRRRRASRRRGRRRGRRKRKRKRNRTVARETTNGKTPS